MQTLLVVDDEPNVLYSLERSLQSESVRVITAHTAQEGIELVRQRRPDVVILDIRLPDMSGLDAFARIHEQDPRLPVIMITAFAATETAIEAMKRGAFEYLLKPFDVRHVREVVGRALELSRLVHVPAVFADGEADDKADRIVGNCQPMQEVYKAIGRVAPLDVNVLILGESGTGKELVARAVYQHSRRADKPFLAINCAAIPETLLESELFGHERGAFTGADRRRIGKFEQAHGGTILLDEIGDMTPATQAKVLRVLQDQRFERLGGGETIQADVRVIAATNQNLSRFVADGKFRLDLYYRLKVYTILLPPLRERTGDMPLLIEHFLRRYNAELGKSVRSVGPDALPLLEQYPWPGNIRELQSTLKFAMVNARGDILTADCLPPGFPEEQDNAAAVGASEGQIDVAALTKRLLATGEEDIYRKVLLVVDRAILGEVLKFAAGNQVEASQILGISRTTLRTKLRALGLAVEKQLLSENNQGEQNLDSDGPDR
ncbi:MAG: sigma-54-dependent transcriptional regulator [Pirellulales bacterium]